MQRHPTPPPCVFPGTSKTNAQGCISSENVANVVGRVRAKPIGGSCAQQCKQNPTYSDCRPSNPIHPYMPYMHVSCTS